jgi:hypothetical protein
MSKSEIRNKFKAQNTNDQNAAADPARAVLSIASFLPIRACLGFRASDFGFVLL